MLLHRSFLLFLVILIVVNVKTLFYNVDLYSSLIFLYFTNTIDKLSLNSTIFI